MRTIPDRPATTPETLLGRFRDTRDPAALGALFDATAPVLLRVALSIAPDAATAENALQETFLAVLEAPDRWDPSRPVMPWLLGILHRQVGKARRDGARVPDPLRLPPPLGPGDPADSAASREEQARVRAAIDELPEPYRAVALLRWRHGLDPADIADVRGEPPGTTRSLLSRALTKLRERLGGGALALFRVPGTRGLDGIRRALLSRAAAVTAASGTTAAAVGGAIVMKKIVAEAVAVLLLLGGTWWTAARVAGSGQEPTVLTEIATAPRVAASQERKRAHEPAVESPPPAEELPPPVDLDRCDRDLDLFGRVIDEDARPVAGAVVSAVSHPWRHPGAPDDADSATVERARTLTARDGTFVLRLTRGEMVDLRAEAAGFGELVRSQCLAGERVTITLRRGATLEVMTVDEAGAPVQGVRLRLWRSAQFDPVMQERAGVTDAAGRFEFTGLIPGPSTLALYHAVLGEPERQLPRIPAAGTLSLRVTMPAGRVVTGRVTDLATGAPVAGVRVGRWFEPLDAVASDADGRYAYPGWTGKGTSSLTATAPGFGGVSTRVPAAGDLDFVLTRGARAAGRVLVPDGSPAPGAFVLVFGPKGQSREGDYLTARTDAEGRFEVDGVQRDLPHWIVATLPGIAKTVREAGVVAVAGGAIDFGDTTLQPARSIEGVATDGDGRPLADTSITLWPAVGDVKWPEPAAVRGHLQSTTRRTDDLGRFRFPDLAPGSYQLAIFCTDAPYTEPTRVVLPADRDVTDVRASLAGSRTLSVLVVGDDGSPIENVSVMADGNFGWEGPRTRHPLMGWSAADGRISFRGLPALEVTLRVGDPSNRYAASVAEPLIPDGQEVRIVMHRAARVAGFVRDETGAAVPNANVRGVPRSEGDRTPLIATTDPDGAFSIQVPAGATLDLRVDGAEVVQTDAGTSVRQTGLHGELNDVTAPAADVVIVVRSTPVALDRKVSVILRDTAGRPVSGTRVSVSSRSLRDSVLGTTDADGRVTIEGLPAEFCYFSVPDHAVSAVDVPPKRLEVFPRGQEIVLSFRRGATIRGRVLDPQGVPVPNAIVDVRMEDYEYYAANCDATGRFAIAGTPGVVVKLSCTVIVSGRPPYEYQDGAVELVVPGDSEITIQLAPRGKQAK